MSHSTSGKGPGITFRADNGTGAVRVSARSRQCRAVLEVLGVGGAVSQVRLSPAELRLLARSLDRVASALAATAMPDEVTQH